MKHTIAKIRCTCFFGNVYSFR